MARSIDFSEIREQAARRRLSKLHRPILRLTQSRGLDFFRQWVQSHNGGGGGGSGGGGNSHGSSDLPACAKPDPDNDPLSTGCSWLRLAGDLKTDRQHADAIVGSGRQVVGQREMGDQIVVTTTDYLPGHSELLTIDSVEGTRSRSNNALEDPYGSITAPDTHSRQAGAGRCIAKAA